MVLIAIKKSISTFNKSTINRLKELILSHLISEIFPINKIFYKLGFYIFLSNFVKVFAKFVDGFFEEIGLGGRPVLAFILAYNGSTRRDHA